MMDELPKDSVVCVLEADNIIESKKTIGQHFPILGGLATADVKYSSKEECIDKTKHIIDECAPGGGYVFCLDKALISSCDVNTDNLKAVHEFVHEYGRYR